MPRLSAIRRAFLILAGSAVLLATSEASTLLEDTIEVQSGETVVLRVTGDVDLISWSQIRITDTSGAMREATLRPADAADLESDSIVRWHPLCRNNAPCTLEFTVVGPQSTYEVDALIESEVFSDATTLTLSSR